MKSIKVALITFLATISASASAAPNLLAGVAFECIPTFPLSGVELTNDAVLQCLVRDDVRDMSSKRVIIHTGAKLVGESIDKKIQWSSLVSADGTVVDLRSPDKSSAFQSLINTATLPTTITVVVMRDAELN